MKKNNKSNKNKIIIIIIILLILLVVGYIIFKIIFNNKGNTIKEYTSINQNPLHHDANQYEITEQESNEINDLMDISKNNAKAIMQFVSFTEPSKVLDDINNKYYLEMILSSSEYAEHNASLNEEGTYINLSGIKEQLKSLTNYEYSDEAIKKYFSNFYKKDTNTYFIPTASENLSIGTLKDGYRVDDKYYLILTNDINIVLEKLVDQYFYRSSTGVKVK